MKSFFNFKMFQRLIDPKEIIGKIFVDIVNDLCPEMKKVWYDTLGLQLRSLSVQSKNFLR